MSPGLLFAQASSNFKPDLTAQTTATAPAAATEEPATDGSIPESAIPSRNVSQEDYPEYVKAMTAIFSAGSRKTDPFGQFQDPDAKPIVRKPPPMANRPAPIPTVSLAEVVDRIEITTIMPAARKFLVGSRTFSQGDQIPVIFQNKQIRLQVVNVTARQIDFRNMENGETAARVLNILPEGMTKGHQGLSAPGIFSEGDAPLQLDQGN